MELIQILLGTLLISYGKKVIWLMVAAIAFLAVQTLLPIMFPAKEQSFILILSLIMAGLLTVLTLFIKKTALIVAGFLGGGFSWLKVHEYAPPVLHFPSLPNWVLFILCGIIGIAIAFVLFNWMITLISAFAGSLLVLQVFSLSPLTRLLLVIPLCVLGAYLQTRLTSQKLQMSPG